MEGATASDILLNRGDWLVGQQTGVWTVTVPSSSPKAAPERIGYVTSRRYREVRGGPLFTMYEVTSLDRNDVIGIVDPLGNAKRFRPLRNGEVATDDVGNSTLSLSVQAVFDTAQPVTLDRATERALAFEALDVNRDGTLDKTELPRLASGRDPMDVNRDGKIDASEFANSDSL
jgi:hypothetical protein